MADEALKVTLNKLLTEQIPEAGYSLEEINNLCFDLGIHPDDVPGHDRPTKSRELILYLDNRGRLSELAALVYQQRPASRAHLRIDEPTEGVRYAHYYGAPEFFAGREGERAMLSEWVSKDTQHRVLCIVALGGFGKSALTWHWLHEDLPKLQGIGKPKRVLWWSFYESAAAFDNLLESGKWQWAAQPIPDNRRGQLDALLKALHDPDTLLIFDGFERELRAFSGMGAAYQGDDTLPSASGEGADKGGGGNTDDRTCVNPLTSDFLRAVASGSGAIRAKVLITTRLLPSALERHGGNLAGCEVETLTALSRVDALSLFRDAKIAGTSAEILEECERYGRHPLSLRLLSCFRAPVEYRSLRKLLGQPDPALNALMERGLAQRVQLQTSNVNHQAVVVLDLHPIVRRYAYARMTSFTRNERHIRLRNFFAAVEGPDKVQTLEDLQPVIELYHHTLRAGQLDAAFELYRDRLDQMYYQFGAYDLIIDLLRGLFPDGEDGLPHLKDESDQASTLDMLANAYSLSGQPRHAAQLFEIAIALNEKRKDKQSLANSLGDLAYLVQTQIGMLRAAEANLMYYIALSREINNEYSEAIGHQELGRALCYCGVWTKAEQEFVKSTDYWRKTNDMHGLYMDQAYQTLRLLLVRRSKLLIQADSLSGERDGALVMALRALKLAEDISQDQFPHVHTFVRAHWLLGAAYRVESGDLAVAQGHLDEALSRCRRINLAYFEGDILIEMARVAADKGDDTETERLATEALTIADRCGYVLQQADAHLELAKLAQRRNQAALAKQHAEQALVCATCDGPPDYTYKVAYEDAKAMLEGMTGDGGRKTEDR